LLRVKLGDEVSKGDDLVTVHAESVQRRDNAVAPAEDLAPVEVRIRIGERMLIRTVRGAL